MSASGTYRTMQPLQRLSAFDPKWTSDSQQPMCYFEWVQRLVLSLRKANETTRVYYTHCGCVGPVSAQAQVPMPMIGVLGMTIRLVIPAAAMLLLSGFTQAELEKAKNTKEFFKDAYWKCLATEIVRVVPTSMSVQEFSVLVKRACPEERNNFFTSLSNYIVLLQPDVDRSTVAPAANIAVLDAQKDAVTALVDLRSGKRERQTAPPPR